MTQGWEIKERLDHVVDAVIDSGDCGTEPTTVVDFSGGEPEVVRRRRGRPVPLRVVDRPPPTVAAVRHNRTGIRSKLIDPRPGRGRGL